MLFSLFLPIFVTISGAYLLFKLKFFFILHPKRTSHLFLSSLKKRENRRSLFLALSGTLGVGNIFGVATGIMIGGAGSVFWLLLSALFSMVIKYSEVLFGMTASKKDGRGFWRVLDKGKEKSALLPLLYALLCLLLSLFMGASLQTKALFEVASPALNIPRIHFLLFFLPLVIISIIKGADRIEKITEITIPLTTIIYIFLALSAIFSNLDRLDDALILIVKEAFSPRAAVGGVLSFAFLKAVSEGFARGVLSNEAGIGTSLMAHSRSETRSPTVAGLYGMCEVFFDTVVICPLTALAILVNICDLTLFTSPMELVTHALADGNRVKSVLLILSVFFFAFSTVICWFYYGEECYRYLFGRKYSFIYFILFLSFVALGAFVFSPLLVLTVDTVILLMSFIVLSSVLKNSRLILEQTSTEGLL